MFTDALSHATRKRRVFYSASRQRLVLLYLTTLLVSNSYSPEPNPGPSIDHSSSPANSQSRSLTQTHSSWICGTCDLAVHWNDRGLVCDQCGQWFHGQCQSVDNINYDLLGDSSTQWFCAICGSRKSKTAFDLHDVDWAEASLPDFSLNSCITPTDLQFQPQHASTPTRSSQRDKWKERPLRVLNINFQSASAKRAEIHYLLESQKPDIILGTETWLVPTIATAEIMPDSYKVVVVEVVVEVASLSLFVTALTAMLHPLSGCT